MGQKENAAAKASEPYEKSVQMGDLFRTNQDSLYTDRGGSPRVGRSDRSPREEIEAYRSMVGAKYDFPQQSGTVTNKKGNNSIRF
jgi:hypothetical protein